jgi:DNA-binding NarL/FixJ family response regulator
MPGAPLGPSNQSSNTALLVLATPSECDELPPGATGLFSIDETPEALGVAIRQVARGEQYLSPLLALALLQRSLAKTGSPESQGLPITELTERETEILALLAQGLSNKAIAARLYLSVRTVEGHLANLYSRLGVHSRTEAMLIATRIR